MATTKKNTENNNTAPKTAKKATTRPKPKQAVTRKGKTTNRPSSITNIKRAEERRKAFLEVFEKSLCNMTAATKKMGIDRSTVYRWRQEFPEFEQQLKDIQETQIDFVESKLMSLINNGDVASTIYYLKTKGKERGWSERYEVTGKEGKDLTPQINIQIIDSRTQVKTPDGTTITAEPIEEEKAPIQVNIVEPKSNE